MGRVYDFDIGHLEAKYRDIVSFNLDIRKPITQIYGNSATGKTLLVNYIKNEKRYNRFNNESADDLSNIFVFDDVFDESTLTQIQKSLIVIDRCDLILTPNAIELIASDRNNHYLLFSRTGLPLGISPNYYGEFVYDSNNIITISYKYSEVNWF